MRFIRRMRPSREDPVLEAHLKANEAERRAFDDAAAPVLADLRAVGVEARSGADLVDVAHEPLPSKEAADVLRSWLTRVDNLGVKETIAQALSERQAGVETARVALSEIRKTPAGSSEESILKERLAFCFEATATPALVKEIFDDLAELVRDPAHGDVRGLLLDMLPGFRTQVWKALLSRRSTTRNCGRTRSRLWAAWPKPRPFPHWRSCSTIRRSESTPASPSRRSAAVPPEREASVVGVAPRPVGLETCVRPHPRLRARF